MDGSCHGAALHEREPCVCQCWSVSKNKTENISFVTSPHTPSAKMSPAADVSRLPTAEGVQTLGDVVGLLTQVRSLERLHEDRSLPTMALVIDTVEQVHSIFRAFVQVNIDDEVAHLVTYGQALLRHTEAYFGGRHFVIMHAFVRCLLCFVAYLAPNSLAARAGFLGCALPKSNYD